MKTASPPLEHALAYAEEHLDETLRALKTLARIPGISANPAPDADMLRSADAVAEWMTRAGLEHVEVLQVEGVHPYVYGDWLHAEGAPTVLLYAHHDVQPAGDVARWTSPPFEPEVRDGRMFGRGVVDDKAGAAIHFAAIEAFLQSGGLPINVRVVIDGEEEQGSEHLSSFLEAYRDKVGADAIVLTDTTNLVAGLPSITVALRGIVVVDVEVAATSGPLHSGMWGGPVPDATLALCKLLAGLIDEQGRLTLPGIYDQIRPMTTEQREQLQVLPFDEADFRSAGGMLEGVGMAGEPGRSPYEQLWYRPAVSVSAFEAAALEGAPNQIVPSARARVGLRTVPDMDSKQIGRALCDYFQEQAPWGVRVDTQLKAAGNGWITQPVGPAFDAASRALLAGFGTAPVHIGCGGSIPFVEPFAQALGGVPALLIGLEDPESNAHGIDESLLLSDFVKALRSIIHLYAELADQNGSAR